MITKTKTTESLPTATFVSPGRSISVKLTTANRNVTINLQTVQGVWNMNVLIA